MEDSNIAVNENQLPDGFVDTSPSGESNLLIKDETSAAKPNLVVDEAKKVLEIEGINEDSTTASGFKSSSSSIDEAPVEIRNISEKCVENSKTQAINKAGPPPEIAENNKKPDVSEVKRKNVKRTFKSEKEFFEFTLQYQQVLAERDSAIAVRDKLESLCRELQRQNKMLMDECKRVSAEGQNLRLELSNKFQDAIKEVSDKLEGQKDDCLSQLKENEMLRIKLKQLADQYVLSEEQYAQKLLKVDTELEEIKETVVEKCRRKSIEQKRYIGKGLSMLCAKDLSMALEIVAQNNPSFHKENEDAVELDLDAQNEYTLWRLKYFVDDALGTPLANSLSNSVSITGSIRKEDTMKRRKHSASNRKGETPDSDSNTSKKRKHTGKQAASSEKT